MSILDRLADVTPRHSGQLRGLAKLIFRDLAEIAEARVFLDADPQGGQEFRRGYLLQRSVSYRWEQPGLQPLPDSGRVSWNPVAGVFFHPFQGNLSEGGEIKSMKGLCRPGGAALQFVPLIPGVG